ncbi:MAG: hypothetical protein OXG59_12765 [Gammaproteobacteria bacterium]|nr:hypothetical protein [Gammaproteobacteria bacterium]
MLQNQKKVTTLTDNEGNVSWIRKAGSWSLAIAGFIAAVSFLTWALSDNKAIDPVIPWLTSVFVVPVFGGMATQKFAEVKKPKQ